MWTGDHNRGDAPLPRLDGVVHRSMYSTAGEGSRLLVTEWRFSDAVVLERQGKTSRGRGPYAKEPTSKGASGFTLGEYYFIIRLPSSEIARERPCLPCSQRVHTGPRLLSAGRRALGVLGAQTRAAAFSERPREETNMGREDVAVCREMLEARMHAWFC